MVFTLKKFYIFGHEKHIYINKLIDKAVIRFLEMMHLFEFIITLFNSINQFIKNNYNFVYSIKLRLRRPRFIHTSIPLTGE